MGLHCLAVLIAIRVAERPTAARSAALGLATALTVYFRPVGAIAMVVPFLVAIIGRKASIRQVVLSSGVAAMVLTLALMPWWMRNLGVYGGFVPLTTASANPAYVASYWPDGPPADASIWPTSSSRDDRGLNQKWARTARMRTASAFRENPWGTLSTRLSMVGQALYVPYEGSTSSIIGFHLSLYSLAVVGVVLMRRKSSLRVVAGIAVLTLAAYSLVFIINRYVLSIMPLVISLTGVGAIALWERMKRFAADTRI